MSSILKWLSPPSAGGSNQGDGEGASISTSIAGQKGLLSSSSSPLTGSNLATQQDDGGERHFGLENVFQSFHSTFLYIGINSYLTVLSDSN
jgi:hypothetical protein